jgi:hypothetical protein
MKDDYRWARGVHREVQDDKWEAFATAEGVVHLEQTDPDLERRVWRGMMELWILDPPGSWNYATRGPQPDEPGCRIPLEIMAEYGYRPGGEKPDRRATERIRARRV